MNESLEKKTCWTCEGKTNHSFPFGKMCLKLAIKNPRSSCGLQVGLLESLSKPF
jgi:hypothetical protein